MTRYHSIWKLVVEFWLIRCSVEAVATIDESAAFKPYSDDVIHTSAKRVLVTGGAGFIGYHVARALVTYHPHLGAQQQQQQQWYNQKQLKKNHQRHTHVVVIDNFNDFYDVNLKRDRAYELSRLGVEVHRMDLCNGSFLKLLMSRQNFSHVVHLAAQASVRHSLNNPNSYVTANIECYLVLLETLRLFPTTKLIYASSSSVYSELSDPISDPIKSRDPVTSHDSVSDNHIIKSRDSITTNNKPRQFRIFSDADHPSNMYAATKRTTEILSDVYCQTAGLRTIGLRFFTVYGPWGRPDMAVFKFAHSVSTGKELPMFAARNNSTLSRDFTYIDDVITGVLAAMNYEPTGCGERFNVGYGHPVPLSRLVEIIEVQLGQRANVKHLPLPPTERLQTWADIEETIRVLKFYPKIDLEEGVKRFIKWFKRYYSEDSARNDQDKISWFSKL